MRGEQCLGYIGIMPGMLAIGDERKKMYWYSTWYVHPDQRHTATGAMLMMATLSLGYDLVATDLAPETLPLYSRLPFKRMAPLPYFHLGLNRLDPLGAPWLVLRVLLKRRGTHLRPVDAVFSGCRRVSKTIVYATLRPVLRGATEGVEFRELPHWPVDEPADRRNDNARIRFHRGDDVIRWMLDNPWVTDRGEDATPGYFFSDHRELFRYSVVEVRRRDGECAGHVVLSVSRDRGRTTVKLLDHRVNSLDGGRLLVAVGLRLAMDHQADDLYLPATCSVYLTSSRMLRAAFRREYRPYFYHSRQHDGWPASVADRVELDFCDGDCANT